MEGIKLKIICFLFLNFNNNKDKKKEYKINYIYSYLLHKITFNIIFNFYIVLLVIFTYNTCFFSLTHLKDLYKNNNNLEKNYNDIPFYNLFAYASSITQKENEDQSSFHKDVTNIEYEEEKDKIKDNMNICPDESWVETTVYTHYNKENEEEVKAQKKCYRIFDFAKETNKQKGGWTDGLNACGKYNGTLATLSSQEEDQLVEKLLMQKIKDENIIIPSTSFSPSSSSFSSSSSSSSSPSFPSSLSPSSLLSLFSLSSPSSASNNYSSISSLNPSSCWIGLRKYFRKRPYRGWLWVNSIYPLNDYSYTRWGSELKLIWKILPPDEKCGEINHNGWSARPCWGIASKLNCFVCQYSQSSNEYRNNLYTKNLLNNDIINHFESDFILDKHSNLFGNHYNNENEKGENKENSQNFLQTDKNTRGEWSNILLNDFRSRGNGEGQQEWNAINNEFMSIAAIHPKLLNDYEMDLANFNNKKNKTYLSLINNNEEQYSYNVSFNNFHYDNDSNLNSYNNEYSKEKNAEFSINDNSYYNSDVENEIKEENHEIKEENHEIKEENHEIKEEKEEKNKIINNDMLLLESINDIEEKLKGENFALRAATKDSDDDEYAKNYFRKKNNEKKEEKFNNNFRNKVKKEVLVPFQWMAATPAQKRNKNKNVKTYEEVNDNSLHAKKYNLSKTDIHTHLKSHETITNDVDNNNYLNTLSNFNIVPSSPNSIFKNVNEKEKIEKKENDINSTFFEKIDMSLLNNRNNNDTGTHLTAPLLYIIIGVPALALIFICFVLFFCVRKIKNKKNKNFFLIKDNINKSVFLDSKTNLENDKIEENTTAINTISSNDISLETEFIEKNSLSELNEKEAENLISKEKSIFTVNYKNQKKEKNIITHQNLKEIKIKEKNKENEENTENAEITESAENEETEREKSEETKTKEELNCKNDDSSRNNISNDICLNSETKQNAFLKTICHNKSASQEICTEDSLDHTDSEEEKKNQEKKMPFIKKNNTFLYTNRTTDNFNNSFTKKSTTEKINYLTKIDTYDKINESNRNLIKDKTKDLKESNTNLQFVVQISAVRKK